MTWLPIRQLGAPGVIRDRDAYELPPNAFSDGNNIRIVDGNVAKCLGYRTLFEPSDYAITTGETVRHLAALFVQGSNLVVIVTDAFIFTWNGSTPVDATPTGGFTAGGDWQHVQVGSALILNNGIDEPFILQPGAAVFTVFTNWPATLRASVIVPFNGFLVAIGLLDGGTDKSYSVRWSDAFDPSATIDPSWDTTDPTTLAGENPLPDADGALIDAVPLASQLILYSQYGAYAMQYVGGQFVFAFRALFREGGILRRGCAVEYQGRHLVVGQSDIYMHDGNTRRSLSDGRITQAFFNEQTDTRSVHVHVLETTKEAVVAFSNRDQNASANLSANRAWVYSFVYDAWAPRDLPDVYQFARLPRFPTDVVTWADVPASWDAASATWQNVQPEYDERIPAALATDADKVYWFNVGYTADGTDYTAFCQQDKLDLDDVPEFGAHQVKHVRQLVPQIEGTGADLEIAIGSSFAPQTGTSWRTPQPFTIDTDYKVDIRATGRYLATRVKSTGTGFWKLTGWDIDVMARGGR